MIHNVSQCLYVIASFCLLVAPGAVCQHLHQPPVLAASLGHNVTMPCHLSHSDEMTPATILYWANLGKDPDQSKLWPPSEEYQDRVEQLSKNQNSANLSILFKNVQWADTGSYECKVSILNPETHKRHRIKGNQTVLLIYGKKRKRNLNHVYCKPNFCISGILANSQV